MLDGKGLLCQFPCRGPDVGASGLVPRSPCARAPETRFRCEVGLGEAAPCARPRCWGRVGRVHVSKGCAPSVDPQTTAWHISWTAVGFPHSPRGAPAARRAVVAPNPTQRRGEPTAGAPAAPLVGGLFFVGCRGDPLRSMHAPPHQAWVGVACPGCRRPSGSTAATTRAPRRAARRSRSAVPSRPVEAAAHEPRGGHVAADRASWASWVARPS